MKIISGGQTGVDRAALDAALASGYEIGGACPKDRRAEDGCIAAHYPLVETASEKYEERTACNVRDADATLILNRGLLTGGTALTQALAMQCDKPFLTVDIEASTAASQITNWLYENRFASLNVAGPRESKAPGIYQSARDLLERVFKTMNLKGK